MMIDKSNQSKAKRRKRKENLTMKIEIKTLQGELQLTIMDFIVRLFVTLFLISI